MRQRRATRRTRALKTLAAAGLTLACVWSALQTPSTYGALTDTIGNTTNTAASAVFGTSTTCRSTTVLGSAYFVYPLGDATNATTATDATTSNRPGTYRNTASTSYRQPGPCPRDQGTGVTINPTNTGTAFVSGPAGTIAGPQTFSVSIWFRTSNTRGGRLVGFGNGTGTTASSSYDRHLYLTNAGKVVFGVYPNAVRTVASGAGLNDGAWHHAVGTLSSTTGLRLYIDGDLVASDTTTTAAQSFTGQWRIGWDNLASWSETPTSQYFQGSLAWAAVHTAVLTPAQVDAIHGSGR